MARLLIVSASMGAGHDRAAAELARRAAAAGHRASVRDLVTLFPARLGHLMRGVHHAQLRAAPALYAATYAGFQTRPRSAARIARVAGWAGPAAAAAAAGADVVVSTYPLANQTLAALRRTGRLSAPLVAYLTDFSVHRLWAAPGVDAYLAVHPVAAAGLRAWAPQAPVAVRGALVGPPPVLAPGEREERRRRLGVPATSRLAVVTAGSWGVGNPAASAREIAALPGWHAVVLCGHNTGLARRLAGRAGITALGWTPQAERLLAAADVVITNAGGMSCLEAFAAGVPVVADRPIPGHGADNVAAMAQAGVLLAAGPGRPLAGLLDAVHDASGLTAHATAMVRRAGAVVAGDPLAEVLRVAEG